jgi:hypothetical protein
MKLRLLMVFVLLSLAAAARQPDKLSELKTRAEAAPPADQARLFIDIARMQFEAAKTAYDSGKAPQAQAALTELSTAADRASQAAIQSRKRLKNTEIDIRKLTEHLKNLKPTVSVDDRVPVQQAIDHLEKLRTELMTQMFAKSK